ncbi:MAG: S-layer homology domain-containing protein [Tissierellia bacterium]|nr:S-layer homology domain-containing protein [Tissierellia bacterium]
MKKKALSIGLVGALILTSLPSLVQAKTFSDVPPNHWAYGVIDEISNVGLMQGIGQNKFSPNTQTTYAEFFTMLYNIAPAKYKRSYSDTWHYTQAQEGAWYAESLKWAYHYMLINNNIYMDPSKPISRGEMALAYDDFLETFYRQSLDRNVTSSYYEDIGGLDYVHRHAVEVLSYNGLIFGRQSGKFVPQAGMTRAESATMLSRVQKFTKEYQDAYSPQVPELPEFPQAPEIPDKPERPSTPEIPQIPEIPLWGTHDSLLDALEYDYRENYQTTYNRAQAEEVLYYVNEYRKMHGVEPVKLSPVLTTAALIRANETATIPGIYDTYDLYYVYIQGLKAQGKSAHTRPDGSRFSTVIQDIGLGDIRNYGLSENLWTPLERMTPKELVDGWYASEGHRRNMLNPRAKYMGFAENNDKSHNCYVNIQLFGR